MRYLEPLFGCLKVPILKQNHGFSGVGIVLMNGAGPDELLMMYKTLGAALAKAMRVSGKSWGRMELFLDRQDAPEYTE